MECNNIDSCPAGKDSAKSCWEIAGERDDYRTAFAVCRDCLVYLVKKENTILSDKEVLAISQHKQTCALA
ncbi:hypothetical protein ACFL6N_05990 [Thermodesulfobacteriota bacterium]